MFYTENCYVLDTDLAIHSIIQSEIPKSQGPIYDIKYIPIRNSINDMGRNKDFYPEVDKGDIPRIIAQYYFDQVLPILDFIRWHFPKEKLGNITYYQVRSIIDSITFINLSPLCKQFYIKLSDMNKERYRVNSNYAELSVPPRGLYGNPTFEQQNKTIVVRGQTSIIKANSTRMLIRLRDGSLLELFEENYNPEEHPSEIRVLFKILDKIMTIDPDYSKKYILAFCLDTVLGRPAYRISQLLKASITQL